MARFTRTLYDMLKDEDQIIDDIDETVNKICDLSNQIDGTRDANLIKHLESRIEGLRKEKEDGYRDLKAIRVEIRHKLFEMID